MELYLYKSAIIDEDFVNWLIPKIIIAVMSSINSKKLHMCSKIFDEEKIKVNPQHVLLSGLRALYVTELKDTFIIRISPKYKYGSTGKSVKSLCSMIEYGNLTNPGIGIFEAAFKAVVERIPQLYSQYLLEFM